MRHLHLIRCRSGRSGRGGCDQRQPQNCRRGRHRDHEPINLATSERNVIRPGDRPRQSARNTRRDSRGDIRTGQRRRIRRSRNRLPCAQPHIERKRHEHNGHEAADDRDAQEGAGSFVRTPHFGAASSSAQDDALSEIANRNPRDVGALAVAHTRAPRLLSLSRAPDAASRTRDAAPVSPRPSILAASATALCSLSCSPAICIPPSATAKTRTTAGSTAANSAVTEPRSAGRGIRSRIRFRTGETRSTGETERMANQVREESAYLTAAQDDDEQSRESHRRQRGDCVLRGGRSRVVRHPTQASES
ncbi:MAG: hypothetical protein JWQ47_2783 [Glaciihabitans sp.]|nr:hypothetical protein [Glaciihabitans sp.]